MRLCAFSRELPSGNFPYSSSEINNVSCFPRIVLVLSDKNHPTPSQAHLRLVQYKTVYKLAKKVKKTGKIQPNTLQLQLVCFDICNTVVT